MTWKQVTKAKLDTFVSAYPSALRIDVTGICEPPIKSYNDFSDGKVWPESVVAKVVLNSAVGKRKKDTNVYYLKEIKK